MPVLMTTERQLDRQVTQLGQRLGQLGFGLAIGDRDDGALLGEKSSYAQVLRHACRDP